MNEDEIADYVSEHTPELDPHDVIAFMRDHDRPDDEPRSHISWAVGLLRQRGENSFRDGPSVDRVADELRRHDA